MLINIYSGEGHLNSPYFTLFTFNYSGCNSQQLSAMKGNYLDFSMNDASFPHRRQSNPLKSSSSAVGIKVSSSLHGLFKSSPVNSLNKSSSLLNNALNSHCSSGSSRGFPFAKLSVHHSSKNGSPETSMRGTPLR